MKYCSQCGNQNDDNARFCAKCGATLGAQQSTPQQNTYTQQQVFVQHIQGVTKRLASNDAINALKLTGSGGAFMTLAIAYSISVLITVVSVFRNIVSMLDVASYLPSGTIASSIGGSIISLAICGIMLAAYWKIYSESRKTGDMFKTGGLSIFSVFLWIAFVLLCIGVFAMIVLSFIAGIASRETGIGIAVFLITLVVLIPSLLYILFAAKSVGNAKKTAQTGIVAGKASVYVAVINIILAIFAFLSMFTSAEMQSGLGDLLYYDMDLPGEVVAPIMSIVGGSGFLMILTKIVSVVSYIASTVVIFNYNAKITPLMNSSAVPYAQPAYRPNANPYSNGVQQPTEPIPPVNPPQDTNNDIL